MRKKLGTVLAALVCLVASTVPLVAHHGYANYDTDRKVTLKGTVTRWVWSNPHILLQLDVPDESGRAVRWTVESENPSTLIRNGWNEKSLRVGDQVTVSALPVKNGNPVGRIIDVLLADGTRLPGRVDPAREVKPEDALKP
jgi:Family of unknown function (DUF6152)